MLLSWWKCTLCCMLMKRRPLKPKSLLIPLCAFIPVTWATWSPVCSVAHLIESPHFLCGGKLFYSASDWILLWNGNHWCVWDNVFGTKHRWVLIFLFLADLAQSLLCFFVFFFKTTEVLNGLGRAEIALECKWFLYFNFIFWRLILL